MKRLNLILITLFLWSPMLFSQSLTKNAEGESTVLFRGNDIGVDIGKTELSLGFNNLRSSLGESNEFIIGGSVKAENKSGLGGLFSKGDIVPNAEFNGFLGWSFSNGLPESYNLEAKKLAKEYKDFVTDNAKKIKAQVDILINRKINTNDLKSDLIQSNKNKDFPIFIRELNSRISNEKDNSKKNELIQLKTSIESDKLIKNIKSEIEKKENKSNTLEEALNKKNYFQFIIFGFGGINASKFKRITEEESITDFDNVFIDEEFRGGNIGLGFNAQFRNIILGFRYNYFETSNFSLLTSKEFTLRTSSTIDDETLISEKKITAYSGSYGEVVVNELSADLIWNLKLDEKSENHILINPYLRAQLNSRNEELLPNSTNIGCGFYFFKQTGKFLGGLYVELPDIDNNYEKAKPIEDQNLRDPLNRISFGIVGKISIGSLLNSF